MNIHADQRYVNRSLKAYYGSDADISCQDDFCHGKAQKRLCIEDWIRGNADDADTSAQNSQGRLKREGGNQNYVLKFCY